MEVQPLFLELINISSLCHFHQMLTLKKETSKPVKLLGICPKVIKCTVVSTRYLLLGMNLSDAHFSKEPCCNAAFCLCCVLQEAPNPPQHQRKCQKTDQEVLPV